MGIKLSDIRKSWEAGSDVKLVLPLVIDDYPVVYVVLQGYNPNNDKFSLHRYFKSTNGWNVSVDKDNCTIEDIYIALNKNFEELYISIGE